VSAFISRQKKRKAGKTLANELLTTSFWAMTTLRTYKRLKQRTESLFRYLILRHLVQILQEFIPDIITMQSHSDHRL
jgi:hypothetical protein